MKYLQSENLHGLRPVKYDRYGPAYSKDDVMSFCLKETIMGTHTISRYKTMSEKIDQATDSIAEATKRFESVFDQMMVAEKNASESAKKVSGSVRKAADDLASGLIKVQKTADFANLERHVLLLERAAAAMSTLAELEKSGKLESLVKAMK